jgi:hypothetical protein
MLQRLPHRSQYSLLANNTLWNERLSITRARDDKCTQVPVPELSRFLAGGVTALKQQSAQVDEIPPSLPLLTS